MRRHIIEQILNTRTRHWLDSIKDPSLVQDLEGNFIVSGGAIASMYLNEPVNDIDVYVCTRELAIRLAEYYVDHFKANPTRKWSNRHRDADIWVDTSDDRVRIRVQSSGVATAEDGPLHPDTLAREATDGLSDMMATDDPAYDPDELAVEQAMGAATELTKNLLTPEEMEKLSVEEQKEVRAYRKHKYSPIYLSSNAITLSHGFQVVIRFYGSPEEIHKNFDFSHCSQYWSSRDRKLVTNSAALESLLTKTLIYKGSLYPVASIVRVRKFIKRGWACHAGQSLKMAMQVSELDLSDQKVLEDQLLGVDAAYFQQLINRINAEKPEVIDATYICELIDQITG